MAFDASVLEMDNDKVIDAICARLREILAKDVGRRGFVVAMSGGIDSSVSSALCVRALGKDLLNRNATLRGFGSDRGGLNEFPGEWGAWHGRC